MRSNNICKFIQPGQEMGLSVSCFILETNLDVIHKKILLTTHRIILVTKGEGTFFFSGQKTSFTAGNLIFGFKDELFHAVSYNPKYISHVFKKHMGVSFTEYLRTLRIRYAVSLFDYGMDSVKNVALLSGFNDPLYFSNVFKKTVGVSPTAYLHDLKVGER